MTDDFEVNETGTVKQLCLTSMALKAAIAYIDVMEKQESCPDPDFYELDDACRIFRELRKELPEDFQKED